MNVRQLGVFLPTLLGAACLVACGGGAPPGSSTNVEPNVAPNVASNAAPTISGSPPSSAMQDELYSYTPSAADADGDALTFSIQNAPPWTSFDPQTGQLSGTPAQADLGVYSNIRISVTDGQASASLAPFQITVVATALGTATLSWQPPTENTDGSPLTDLAGFKVRWGTSPGSYTNLKVINNPGITTYVVDNLTPNTYYFVATAFDTGGIESTYSNMVSKTIR